VTLDCGPVSGNEPESTGGEGPSNNVGAAFGCPACHEQDADKLTIDTDTDRVTCACGCVYSLDGACVVVLNQ
jgi:hypothetical protein